MPTDTVYGLAVDATDPSAVARLREVKGYDDDVLVPVLIGGLGDLDTLGVARSSDVHSLAERFWPGALTLVCRAEPGSRAPRPGGALSVRMPDHPVALGLLRAAGPLAVSSAGRVGLAPAKTVDEAVAVLASAVEVYLDAGPASTPVRSTILDLTESRPALLRSGAITEDDLRAALPNLRTLGEEQGTSG
jgi:L-threonylcarbamoyladenylate synthase